MKSRRKPITLFDHERAFLESAYLRHGVPLEHFDVRKDALHALCSEFRSHCSRNDSDEDVFHYMRNRRKNGRKKNGSWPRLGNSNEPQPALPELTAEQIEVLVDIYYEHVADLGNGSDSIAYEPEVKAMIATEFMHRTGSSIPGEMLVGSLTKLRKRGLLPKVRRESGDDTIGFDDFGLVG